MIPLFKNLSATDLIVVAFASILSIINLIFINVVDNWLTHILLNSLLIIFVFTLAYYDKHLKNILLSQLHFWYLVPLIFLFFKEIYFMIQPIRGGDYDYILIAADRFIFGANPTELFYKISNPYLTELLQIVYATFFFLPVILGIVLILSQRYSDFNYAAFIIVLGFFLSYFGYFIFPAIGPRFTLHNFATNDLELPGLFLTKFLREIVNSGESIPTGTLNPALIVQRDVFPSGHTQMTLLVMYLSIRFKTKSRYFFIPDGTLLIFSTVYLRYHYVIDLIGGVIFMIATLWIGRIIYNKWMKFIGEPEYYYKSY
ncbi:MAG: phosphatase PAP2 family protein [bacterium]